MTDNNDLLAIVHFTHPGKEHGLTKGEKKALCKGWNMPVSKPHARKFISSRGDYIDGRDCLQKNTLLLFWGEWEPDSEVIPLPDRPDDRYPEYVHTPFVREGLEDLLKNAAQQQPQNTDPFVFGKMFKYALCKQAQKNSTDKNGIVRQRATNLAKLAKGSLILFGSNYPIGVFQLDTVFVVAGWKTYYANDIEHQFKELENDGRVDKGYVDLVQKVCFPKKLPELQNIACRLYFGVTYAERDKFDGMYSFVPARPREKETAGFPRVIPCIKKTHPLVHTGTMKKVILQEADSRTTEYGNAFLDLNEPRYSGDQVVQYRGIEPKIIKSLWQRIRDISREQGCVEAVRFGMPPVKE